MRNTLLALMVVTTTLTVSMTGSAATTHVPANELRAAEHPDGTTRLVIELDQDIHFKTHLLADPMRLVIDSNALTWQHRPSLARSVGPFLAIAYAEDDDGGHLTLRLGRPSEIKSAFMIPPRDSSGWRLVVDVKDTTRQAFLARAEHDDPPPTRPRPDQRAKTEDGDTTAATLRAPAPERPMAAPAVSQASSSATPQPARMIVVTSPNVRPNESRSNESRSTDAQPVRDTQLSEPVRQQAVTASMVKGGDSLTAPMPPPPTPVPAPPPAPVRTVAVATSPATSSASAVPSSASEDDSVPPSGSPATVALAQPVMPDRDAAEMPGQGRKRDGRPIVVIDPGHGGVDPGAISVTGVYEKTITFGMARELKRQLEKTGHYRVFLTRERDIFIPLRDRITISRHDKADLFISLHADVDKDPTIHGLSVYTLSQDASDVEAQSLADKENKADLIAGVDLSHESSDVTNILIDLAQRETMNRSAVFAGTLVEELQREIPLLGNTHRFAGFAVLKAPDVPAVLVEMGYLSNQSDERNLRQEDYRTKLARSITRAVDSYFLMGQKAKRL